MLLWIVFAVMTAAVLIAVLRPLATGDDGGPQRRRAYDVAVYKDQLDQVERERAEGLIDPSEAEAAKLEISRRLLALASESEPSDRAAKDTRPRRWTATGIVVVLPTLVLGLYLVLGSPGLPGQPFDQRQAQALDNQELIALLARVESHLRENPDDARGWRVIAPGYMRLGRFQQAARAYLRVIELGAGDADVLARYGEALVLAEQGLVTELARHAFIRSHELDRAHPKARFYLGLAQQQDGNIDQAVEMWRALLDDAPPDAAWRPMVEAYLGRARIGRGQAPTLSSDDMEALQDLPPEERLRYIESMVSRLAARLEADGNDIEGWIRLVRSQAVLGRGDAARASLAKATQRFAEDEEAMKRLDEVRDALGLGEEQR